MLRELELSAPPDDAACQLQMGRWSVREYARVTSTNWLAARLPAWHAVRADCQTAGRGRFQRRWISDEGGLWLSAVVPVAPKSPGSRILPLAAGLAVCQALRSLGVAGLRMRWPNDLLLGERKLAGLLLDQFAPTLAVVGVGINVRNRPEASAAELHGHVARLADLLLPVPSLRQVMEAVLASLEAVWLDLEKQGPEALLPRINALWQTPVGVELNLDGHRVWGQFQGVDVQGRLLLGLKTGETKSLEPQEVQLLRESLLEP